ncbi:MAG: adenylate/guanylate cyclase domain-containing protein, partial [Actinomycetes bacterium]
MSLESDSRRLAPYVPRLVVDWLRNSPRETVREVNGSLAFLDISGFTRLTERLARRGKEGAEEMSEILNGTFASLLDVGYQDGAGLVKWGGDAVLLLFDGPEHATRAARATFRMRATLRSIGRLQTSAGAVVLRMSAGIHSGTFHFFLVGDPAYHRELLIAGPAASLTAETEALASAGEIALSADAAVQVPQRCLGATREGARLLRAEPKIETLGVPPAKSVDGLRLADVLPRQVRDHLLAQSGDAEHRTISVGFVEFSGTDELLRSEGPRALASALTDVVANIQRATDQFGVTFFETDINRDGGKVMLTAGAPVSHGHDEDRMLRAARQIIEHQGRLGLRIGVNRGAVFAGDFGPPFRRTYSVKGDAINLAARVMAKADRGQVLATREVIDRGRTDFEVTEVPPFQVKGKTRAIEACAVGPAAARQHATVDDRVVRSREAELQRLRDQIALASAGTGSVTVIDGERGSGRSRVVAELPSLAGDISLVRISCDEYESTTPYVAVRRLFKRAMGLSDESDEEQVFRSLTRVAARSDGTLTPWLPLLGVVLGVDIPETPESSELDDEFRKPRMEAAAVELLALTLPGPAVLVVDDVHNLDEASHGILAGILDAARHRRPWSVMLTLRTGADTPWWSDPESSEAPTLRLQLGPLSETQAIDLVNAETEDRPLPPATIESIVRRSGGNPLFLHSLLSFARSGQDLQGLPETIEDLVTVEIDKLAPTERRILRFASVLGTRVDADLLARMLGDEWISPRSPRFKPLLHFLTPARPGQLHFRNSLYRDVAYQALPFGRRRDLHEQAGAALLARAGDQGADDAERLAWHFHLADRPAQTWTYARLAAEQAQAQFAQSEAATFLTWAVRAGRRSGAPAHDLAQVLESLGDTQFLLGLSSDARRSYQDAFRVAPDDAVRGAKLQLKLARLDQRVGHLSQSLRRLTRGMRLLRNMDEPRAQAIEAELATRYAIGRFQQGRYRDAKQWGDRAVAIAERSG